MHDIFVVDYTGDRSLQQRFPHARFVEPRDRLELYVEIAQQTVTEYAWVLDNRYSYSDFSFAYTPPWHQATQLHVWSTNTVLLPAYSLLQQASSLDAIQNYQHVCWHTETVPLQTLPDIVIWNFGDASELEQRYPDAKVLRYHGTHLDMLRRSAERVDTPDFWVLSSCCSYDNFDPQWKPAWESEGNLHCWASGTQQFGDTFYVDTAQFRQQAPDLVKLEYYRSVYWHSDGYPRRPWPVNYIEHSDLFTALKTHRFSSTYEYFVTPGSTLGSTVDPSLWEKRHLIAYNTNGHVSLCPRDCISHISTKVKDYPYIQYHKCENSTQKPQDVVFISYDEKNADLNYDLLKKQCPTALRVHGVKGNVAAYKAAAQLSTTPWYYAVFPKTEIDPGFDFNYHPDYLEQPGHYIFYAYNTITDYSYGHGGVKMYHVKTTLEIAQWGYDFTMSSPVTTIPVISCTNRPATPFEAWRTSFREVLKLREMNTVESQYRLHRWLTVGLGEFGEYSKRGARAALEYNGDLDVANSWEWLLDQFNNAVN